MIDTNRALQPLNEAERAIAQLQTYESSAELASALQATNAAVQRTLRSLLRFDRGAPDDLRMAALSPTDLTPDRLIPALRQRDLISLELAGQIHELDLATQRAARDQARASDADLALRVVDHLRDEVHNRGEKNLRTVAHSAITTGAVEEEPHIVPLPGKERRSTRFAVVIAAIAIVGVLAWWIFARSSSNEGVEAYRAGRYAEAERIFEKQVHDDVSNTTAAFYLSRLYRRERRFEDARKVLQRAIDEKEDAFLRYEAGALFMETGHPDRAIAQFERATELDPDEPRNWVQLIRAQRAAGDPNAEATLQRAPDEARALLQGRQ